MPRGDRGLVGVEAGGRGEGGRVEDLEGAARVAGERAFAAAVFFHFGLLRAESQILVIELELLPFK